MAGTALREAHAKASQLEMLFVSAGADGDRVAGEGVIDRFLDGAVGAVLGADGVALPPRQAR